MLPQRTKACHTIPDYDKYVCIHVYTCIMYTIPPLISHLTQYTMLFTAVYDVTKLHTIQRPYAKRGADHVKEENCLAQGAITKLAP